MFTVTEIIVRDESDPQVFMAYGVTDEIFGVSCAGPGP